MQVINQVFPEKKQVQLKALYLDQRLTKMGYRVIMMVSGPHMLDLLLTAKRLDLLYVIQAQVEIPFDDPKTVQTMLLGGKNISELREFRLAHQFMQENVLTEAGSLISQSFLRYDRQDLPG